MKRTQNNATTTTTTTTNTTTARVVVASLLLSEGYEPDIIYTSRLKRAVKSTWTILNALDMPFLPVYKSWRLNERNYGALTGLRKMDAARELGVGVVQAW
jgi:2,3-bisphosphoglycerate-dependent phosphoglycerate mutase